MCLLLPLQILQGQGMWFMRCCAYMAFSRCHNLSSRIATRTGSCKSRRASGSPIVVVCSNKGGIFWLPSTSATIPTHCVTKSVKFHPRLGYCSEFQIAGKHVRIEVVARQNIKEHACMSFCGLCFVSTCALVVGNQYGVCEHKVYRLQPHICSLPMNPRMLN